MELADILQALISLVFVLSLIAIIAFLYKKHVVDKNLFANVNAKKRLKVEDTIALDHKTRVILLSKDGKEEFLVVSGSQGYQITPTENIKNSKKKK